MAQLRRLLAVTILGTFAILLSVAAGVAAPISVIDTVDFNDPTVVNCRNSVTCVEVEFNGAGNVSDPATLFSWSHSLTFDSGVSSIIPPVELELSHYGNSNSEGEVWVLYGGTSTYLGQLGTSVGNDFVQQTFTIPSSLYPALPIESGDTWVFTLKLFDNTGGRDQLQLDYSTLSFEYERGATQPQSNIPQVVPEPTMLAFLGLGLFLTGRQLRKLR